MKHLRIKNKVRFTISMLIIFVSLLSIISAVSSKAFSYQAPQYQEIVVSQGDTLWSLCQNLKGNIHENIYQIQKVNELEGCNIYVGQVLKIPII